MFTGPLKGLDKEVKYLEILVRGRRDRAGINMAYTVPWRSTQLPDFWAFYNPSEP